MEHESDDPDPGGRPREEQAALRRRRFLREAGSAEADALFPGRAFSLAAKRDTQPYFLFLCVEVPDNGKAGGFESGKNRTPGVTCLPATRARRGCSTSAPAGEEIQITPPLCFAGARRTGN